MKRCSFHNDQATNKTASLVLWYSYWLHVHILKKGEMFTKAHQKENSATSTFFYSFWEGLTKVMLSFQLFKAC